MTHWAAPLIGTQYTDGSDGLPVDGPHSFNCWGLVRWIFRHIFNIPMPAISVNVTEQQEPDIRAAVRASGWRAVSDQRPRENDILLMWGDAGRHVGLAVKSSGSVQLLHAVEGAGVMLTPISDLRLLGFGGITCWRKQ